MITTALRRLTAHLAWSDVLRPRVAWVAMAASALVAGAAIQHSIERLEAASEARARLERQNAGLHERYLATPGATTPALQQIRASHDEAVASAAAWSHWTVWGSLVWMFGVGAASAWSLQRRARMAGTAVTPADTSCSITSKADEAHPTAATTRPPTAAPDWQAVLREIQAVSELIGPAEDPPSAGAAPVVGRIEPVGTERATERPLMHRLPSAEIHRVDLRLAA
ncbi:hypothetical protein [Sphaerotilus microaerophilus]|uniref:Uncharacterized protein n=1 Tax=Sphaerotilus microaerophilus TaxID=2914710 RepID=A0ABM7YHR0_9BURK|nr:hypothetical protein [Sphaerotilus sp. FB-5]BDI03722.1 hypothetical protein CATMQ487_06920 [Sphaerotilus sp. FB-5]